MSSNCAGETIDEYRARMRPRYFLIFDRLPRAVRDAINHHSSYLPIADAFDQVGIDVVEWIESRGMNIFDEVFEL